MIRLIAAIDRKQGIAKHGYQPWYIPDDQAYFAELTKSRGGLALIGSITYKTFHGPLADRQNFVLTHDTTPIDGVTLVHDLDAFLRDCQGKDLWVIGGVQVFAAVMAAGQADELYLTHIEADFGCDQFFPAYEAFILTERSQLHEQNGFIFTYARYTKAT